MAWNELVKMSLLGTEKLPLQTAVLPAKIREIVEKSPENDRETAFLKAAALTWLYEKAGQKPAQTPLPNIVVAPDENLKIAPPQYVALLRRLLGEEKLPIHLLLGLLSKKMADKNIILPSDLLVVVLTVAEKTDLKKKPELLQKVIGERGKWLAQFNKKWAFLTPKSDADIWENGSNDQRLAFLLELRKTNPQQAFEYVKEAWATANGSYRQQLLRVLGVQPRIEEQPFLEALLAEFTEKVADSKSKNVNLNNIRIEIIQILLKIPSSDVYQFFLEKMHDCLKTDKIMFGLSSKTRLILPEKEDDFFNTKKCKADFDISDTHRAVETHFLQYVAAVNPQIWETLFGENWVKNLEILNNTEGVSKDFKKQLLANLAFATANTDHKNSAVEILKTAEINETSLRLFSLLSDEELGKMAFEKLTDHNLADFVNALRSRNKIWSKSFSTLIIKYLAQPNDHIRRNSEAAKNACLHFDPSVLNELYDLSRQEFTDYRGQQLRSELVFPMIKLLEYKLEINRI